MNVFWMLIICQDSDGTKNLFVWLTLNSSLLRGSRTHVSHSGILSLSLSLSFPVDQRPTCRLKAILGRGLVQSQLPLQPKGKPVDFTNRAPDNAYISQGKHVSMFYIYKFCFDIAFSSLNEINFYFKILKIINRDSFN